ncbi:MAG: CocE/NonD family hydrolase [Gemmatimonadetes bacterium]|nr:CocE/NonD family hydrolase [Gemmatimonadota bacterium]
MSLHEPACGCHRLRRLRRAGAAFLLLAALRPAAAQVRPPAAEPSRMPPPGWKHSPARYEALLWQRDVMVPTRDGARMATDVWRPARGGVPVEGRFPVLLNRTPYNKGSLADQARFYAERGYAVALQDARGRYKSEGEFSKVQPKDATDGYDTVEWLARQPWADGRVGMWGTSFSAHMQAGAAQFNPPSLKALLLNMGGLKNGWDHGVRYRGTYEFGRQLTWAWSQLLADARTDDVKALLTREKAEQWYDVTAWRRGVNPLAVSPQYEGWFFDFWQRADYDASWKDPMLAWDEHYPATADIPMLHVGGWYDIFLAGTVGNFQGLRALKRAPQQLLIGPWTHGGNNRPYAGDVSFGDSAAIPDFLTDFHVRWFDHHLKGEANGAERDPAVRLFIMGTGDGHKDADGRLFHGGYWTTADRWPLPDARTVSYYFHAGGGLRPVKPAAAASGTTYTFDPYHPVPTVGGGSSARLKDGAYDQREDPRFPPSAAPWRPLRARPDVVVFQTEPLAEDVLVAGPITVELWASASTVDTDLTAKLVDVYPSSTDWPGGFDLNLTDAIVRARYRASRTKAQPLVPGRVTRFTIEPFPTANVFKKGHRIRVDISSSNFPRFDVNPNTGAPSGPPREMVPARITIRHDAAHPSRLLLPIVPLRR